MSTVERPRFPIGFQWVFSPNSALWTSDLLNTPQIVDFVCLPAEASMLYGGPMADLVTQVAGKFQTTIAASWLKFPPAMSWDPVYRESLEMLSQQIDPASIYFENYRPKLSELSAFEIEMKQVTDATPVLNIPFQWQANEILWDELWLAELLRKTKMQVCLRLDHAFTGVTKETVGRRQEKILRLVSYFKEQSLRLAEIRLPVAQSEDWLWQAQVDLWKTICFDEAASTSIVFLWNEPESSVEQLRSALKVAHSFRIGHEPPTRGTHVAKKLEHSSWRTIFESVFPRLVEVAGWDHLEPFVNRFLVTLDEGEWDRHETLRRWPIFLKVSGEGPDEWLDLSRFDWAQFSALFHPADEEKEQLQLKAQELKQNPTLQVVRQRDHLSVTYRARQKRGNLVHSRELTWYEAAVLDELHENAKVELTGLVDFLVAVKSPQNLTLSRETWLSHIAEMARQGLILFSQADLGPS